jgi:hypothetical protein
MEFCRIEAKKVDGLGCDENDGIFERKARIIRQFSAQKKAVRFPPQDLEMAPSNRGLR